MKMETKFEGLKERLKADVLAGKHLGRLPNIHSLGAAYTVNFKTINKAISALVREGFLYRQRGKGTFVVGGRETRSDVLGLFYTLAPQAIAGTVVLFENITAVVSALVDKPYRLSLQPLTEGASPAELESMAVKAKGTMDGALLIGGGRRLVDIFRRIRFRYVALYADWADVPGINSVDCDDRAGAFDMTEHLIGLGHRRIAAILGSPGYVGYRLRLQGYRDALARHGLAVAESLIKVGGSGWESGYGAMNELLRKRERPTAVFCFSDFRAMGAIECAQQRGVRVPEEIAIVGFDGIQAAELAKPALTTVAVPRHAMAATALDMLVDWVSDKDYVPHRKVIRPKLLIRESAGSGIATPGRRGGVK